jgi:hypothetical protein
VARPHQRVSRAALPAGVEATAHWSETRKASRLELRDADGIVLVAHELARTTRRLVDPGATVRRGDRLVIAVPDLPRASPRWRCCAPCSTRGRPSAARRR